MERGGRGFLGGLVDRARRPRERVELDLSFVVGVAARKRARSTAPFSHPLSWARASLAKENEQPSEHARGGGSRRAGARSHPAASQSGVWPLRLASLAGLVGLVSFFGLMRGFAGHRGAPRGGVKGGEGGLRARAGPAARMRAAARRHGGTGARGHKATARRRSGPRVRGGGRRSACARRTTRRGEGARAHGRRARRGGC